MVQIQGNTDMAKIKCAWISNSPNHIPRLVWCTWSAKDWSCDYDTIIITILSTYQWFSTTQQATWTLETPVNCALGPSFDHLLSSEPWITYLKICDHLSDYLSGDDPVKVPWCGWVSAATAHIFEYLSIPPYLFSTHGLLPFLVNHLYKFPRNTTYILYYPMPHGINGMPDT